MLFFEGYRGMPLTPSVYQEMRLTQQEVVACFFCAHDDPLFQGLKLSTLFPVEDCCCNFSTQSSMLYVGLELIVSCPLLHSM